MSIDHEDRQVVTVPRWVVRECDGDPRDAMVLAQITWWFQPSQRDGSPRTKQLTERDGERWMYLTDAALADDLGLHTDQVRRARRSLQKRGLIDCRAGQVEGRKVTLVRPTITGNGGIAESTSETAESPNHGNGGIAESHARATPPVEPRRNPLSADADAGSQTLFGEPPAAKPTDAVKDEAHRVTTTVWERSDPKPVWSFIGVQRMAERFLRGGWTGPEIIDAMLAVPSITQGWVEPELKRRRPQRRDVDYEPRDAPGMAT